MNTLSVLIYFASVSEYIRNIAEISLLGLVVLLIPVFVGFMFHDNEDSFKAYGSFLSSKFKYYFRLVVFFGFIFIFVPTKNTIMLIVASEFAEIAVKSEQITSIVNPSFELLKTWIDTTTQELKDKSK